MGRVVVRQALARGDINIVACVRSERAASELPPIPTSRGRVARIDFEDPESLRDAFRGAAGLIHLPGLLIETASSSYQSANVDTLRVAIGAVRAEGVASFLLVGAVGADAGSENPYFRSKGIAEQLLIRSGLAYTVLRVPLVLGCASEGARAFARDSAGGLVALIGGGRAREQPIDARDLAAGALNAAMGAAQAQNRVLDLVGPESLPMRELVRRGARLRGARLRIVPLPTGPLKLLLALRSRFTRGGLSPGVIDVMQREVRMDPGPAVRALGIELSNLDDTIRRSLEDAKTE